MLVNLPTSTISDITGVVTGLFTDFLPLIIIILGTILGLWVAGKVIEIVRSKEKTDDLN